MRLTLEHPVLEKFISLTLFQDLTGAFEPKPSEKLNGSIAAVKVIVAIPVMKKCSLGADAATMLCFI